MAGLAADDTPPLRPRHADLVEQRVALGLVVRAAHGVRRGDHDRHVAEALFRLGEPEQVETRTAAGSPRRSRAARPRASRPRTRDRTRPETSWNASQRWRPISDRLAMSVLTTRTARSPFSPQRLHERGRPRRTRRSDENGRHLVIIASLGPRARLASHLTGEFHPRGVHVHIVGDEDAAFAQRVPGGLETEAHALIGVLAVVHEEVDRADAVEQRRELVLRPTEHQLPTIAKRRRYPSSPAPSPAGSPRRPCRPRTSSRTPRRRLPEGRSSAARPRRCPPGRATGRRSRHRCTPRSRRRPAAAAPAGAGRAGAPRRSRPARDAAGVVDRWPRASGLGRCPRTPPC